MKGVTSASRFVVLHVGSTICGKTALLRAPASDPLSKASLLILDSPRVLFSGCPVTCSARFCRGHWFCACWSPCRQPSSCGVFAWARCPGDDAVLRGGIVRSECRNAFVALSTECHSVLWKPQVGWFTVGVGNAHPPKAPWRRGWSLTNLDGPGSYTLQWTFLWLLANLNIGLTNLLSILGVYFLLASLLRLVLPQSVKFFKGEECESLSLMTSTCLSFGSSCRVTNRNLNS